MPIAHASAISLFALTAALSAQMGGTYTVNPTLPASATNFASLLDATNALSSQGVLAPVTIEVYDDAGPYTEAAPFVTTNGPYAPNTAVLVLGSWVGTSAINRVTFRPAAGEAPRLDAAGRAMGIFWGGADYVTVQGFEIENAIYDGISLYAEASHGIAQDPIIDSCRIHDCGGTGITIYGNTPQPANTLVQNCSFWSLQLTNAGSFSTTGRFGYITTRRSSGTRIVHNTFLVDAGVGGMFCVIGAYPSATTEQPYAEFSNNVVLKTANSAAPIYRMQSPVGASFPTPVICDSNCLHDLTGAPFALYGDNAGTTAAALVDWQIGVQRDLASLTADPQLRDLAAHDFHLTNVSPCIGTSTVATGVVADFDGQPRTGALDLGADEYSNATITAVGAGCPGGGGVSPVLRSHAWPFLGNPALDLTVEQMPPNLFMFLFGSLGLAANPLPFGAGCNVYLELGSFVALAAAPSGPGGTASIVFSVPNNAAFVGFDIGYQSLVLDAGAPLGLSMTNGLEMVFAF